MTSWIRESNLIEGVNDVEEDKRSREAWDWFLGQQLTLTAIRMLHGMIMLKKLPACERGKWRTCGVVVGGRLCPHYSEVPNLMANWVASYADAKEEPIIKAAHVAFEKIHPFVDGNGRTGRMVMNWQRVNAGLGALMLRSDERGAYYEWFREPSRS